MMAFLSYAHEDEQAMKDLRKHAAVLERERLISIWEDREILPGDPIDELVDSRIEEAALLLLLISPDFIDSDYCMGREMKRALELFDKGTARVVPIIVRPCDWMGIEELNRFKALPKDAIPISRWRDTDEAWLNVISELRRLIQEMNSPDSSMKRAESKIRPASQGQERMRNVQVNRDFSEIDVDDFRERAFEVFREYFKQSVEEIVQQDGVHGKYRENDAKTFSCSIDNLLKAGPAIHIVVRTDHPHMPGCAIYWTFDKNVSETGMHGSHAIKSDGYNLFLESNVTGFSRDLGLLSPEQAAEILWRDFISKAHISYD